MYIYLHLFSTPRIIANNRTKCLHFGHYLARDAQHPEYWVLNSYSILSVIILTSAGIHFIPGITLRLAFLYEAWRRG